MSVFLERLYPWAHKKLFTESSASSEKIRWEKLSNYFDTSFQLGQGGLVGEVRSNGFSFKLNFLNYYPIVPTVSVEQHWSLIKVRQFYDRKAKLTQIYWLTIFMTIVLVVPFGVLREVLNPKFETNLEELLIVLFFECVFILVLCLFSFQRSVLWKESIAKTDELLALVQLERPI